MTAGFAEVALKRREWAQLSKKNRKQLLSSHWFPAVLGPRGRSYIVDHHHLGLALHEEGVERVKLMVLDDLSYLAPTIFWRVMEQRNWVHPFDETGKRRPYTDIPARITDACRRSASQPGRHAAQRPAASRRTRRRSPNSCGPTTCARTSRARRSARRWTSRCARRKAWPRARSRATCPAGAGVTVPLADARR